MIAIRYGTWIVFILLTLLAYPYVSNSGLLFLAFLVVNYFVSTKIFYYFRLYTSQVMCFDVNGVLVKGNFKCERLNPTPGIYDLLHSLRQTHVVIIIGNNNELFAVGLDKRLGFDKLFDHRFQSSMFGVKKPDPLYYIAVARRIGVSPNKMVFADDQEENIVGAKKAGLKAFVFTTTEKFKKDLNSIAINS